MFSAIAVVLNDNETSSLSTSGWRHENIPAIFGRVLIHSNYKAMRQCHLSSPRITSELSIVYSSKNVFSQVLLFWAKQVVLCCNPRARNIKRG